MHQADNIDSGDKISRKIIDDLEAAPLYHFSTYAVQATVFCGFRELFFSTEGFVCLAEGSANFTCLTAVNTVRSLIADPTAQVPGFD